MNSSTKLGLAITLSFVVIFGGLAVVFGPAAITNGFGAIVDSVWMAPMPMPLLAAVMVALIFIAAVLEFVLYRE